MLRFLTAGESHGKGLVAVLEGIPANLELAASDIDKELARRQVGYGRGGRMKLEEDKAEIISGVRFGKTLGSPIAMLIRNRDFENWKDMMSEVRSPKSDVETITKLRPGHADYAGAVKYHQDDIRNILERASARETAARVAVGAVCKKLLDQFEMQIGSHVVQIGEVSSAWGAKGESVDGWREIFRRAEQSDLRCADPKAADKMCQAIDAAYSAGDSIGGVFEVVALDVPVGLGSYVHWDTRLDGQLAGAVMSVPAVKGVEIGLGFAQAELPGSQVHDEIFLKDGRIYRKTNHAGGLEGGITNGEPVVIRAVMKPIATLKKPLRTIDWKSKKPTEAQVERADTCAVAAAGVVGEAMVAFTLAQAFLVKFGGDSVEEIKPRT